MQTKTEKESFMNIFDFDLDGHTEAWELALGTELLHGEEEDDEE